MSNLDIKESSNENDNVKAEDKLIFDTESGARKKFQENIMYLFLLSLGFGLLFTICFYDYYKNFNGILYPVFVIGLFVFTIGALMKMEVKIRKDSFIFIAAAVLLGISSFLTMNYFIVALNTMGIGILYTLFLTRHFYEEKQWELVGYLTRMIELVFQSIGNVFLPFKHLAGYYKPKDDRFAKWKPILKGIFFGILFLCIVIPLLASADMVFANIVGKFTFHLEKLFQGEWYIYLLFTIGGTLIFYGMLYAVSKKHEESEAIIKDKKNPVSALVMTLLITAVYVLFCGIQIIYLFGGNMFQLPAGITYARYAHQGFFQLLFVVAINIGMVLLCLSKAAEHKGLKSSLTLISGCTFIMIMSAFYRMILYVNVYHLTFLRILVLWFLTLLTVTMAGIVYYIYHREFLINRFLFYTALSFYLIFAYMKPDYIVAEYNINHIDQISNSDMYYLTGLSLDAVPALSKIEEEQFAGQQETDYNSSPYTAKGILNNYYYNISISDSYVKGIRNFNLSRYQAYQTASNRKGH